MKATLSPLTRARLEERKLFPGEENGGRADTSKRGWDSPYLRYRCHACGSLSRSEWDAERCCPPETEKVWVHPTTGEEFTSRGELADAMHGHQDAPALCPVCGDDNADIDEAANCCLWRDLDVTARYRIARLVEGGSDWASAIAAETD